MGPRVSAAIERNGGLISRREAKEAGLTAQQIDRLVRTREWTAVRRAVYAPTEIVAAATTLSARQRLIDRAACMRITRPFVRSHTTAALEMGMPVLLPQPAMTHVTRPNVGTHNEYGVKHHLAPYDKSELVRANGFLVLDAARTAIDIAREYGHPYGMVAVDSARLHGVTIADLETALARMKFWPDRRAAVDAIELSAPGAESVGESLARDLLYELGRTDVQTQFGITDGSVEAWADLRVGRHLVEFDGRVKYQPVAAGGLAAVEPGEVVWEEKRREDFFRGFHLGMSRLSWDDVWGPGRRLALARLDREIAATDRLWGRSIADLAPFILQRSRRRAS